MCILKNGSSFLFLFRDEYTRKICTCYWNKNLGETKKKKIFAIFTHFGVLFFGIRKKLL